MVKKLHVTFVAFLFILAVQGSAQVVQLKSGILDLALLQANPFDVSNTQAVFNKKFYGLAHSDKTELIHPKGVISWLSPQVALVHVGLENTQQEVKYYTLASNWKIDPLLQDSLTYASGALKLKINVYEYNTLIQEALVNYGTLGTYDGLNRSISIDISADSVLSLLNLPFVYWAEFPAPPLEMHNLRERTNHRVPLVNSPNGPFNLTGKGVIMGEWDGGGADEHIDYQYRMTRIDNFVNNGNGRHATHVAGTMLGAGIKDPNAKGMAPEATFYSYDFFGNVTAEMDSAARKYRIEFTQNSYGYSPGFDVCSRRGTYDNTSVGLDRLVNKYPNLLHVFSAGNSRSSNCLGGGYGTVGSGFQASKNSLAVGAVRFTDVNSWFSSYGPVRDGRLKPEITAVGVDVYSTFPNNTYRGGYNGTSMSCPGTSGTAALITQLYKETFDTLPDAHLIKGVLCNGADDLGRSGPDYQYGFGRLNAFVAANIVADSNFRMDTVRQGTTIKDTLYIDNPHLFKLMLCYSDPESVASTNHALINDLDLYVVDDNGDTTRPWILNPTSPTTNAFRGVDTLNNIEQITIEQPTSSYYIYHVHGTSIPSGNQIFSVNWLEQDTSLTVVYPNGGEKWLPPSTSARQQIIRWEAHGLGGNATISYSTNKGSTWNVISSAVNLNTGYYVWQTCPASVNTAEALIKIEQGIWVDSSDGIFDIFETGPTPTSVPCSEQLHITWSPIANATSYKVHMNDSGKMKVMGTTDETFFTIKGLSDTESYWVAISAISTNGAEGPRGTAIQFNTNPIDSTPTFVRSPRDTNLCSGSSTRFDALTVGTGTITRQWQVSNNHGSNWTDIPSSNLDLLNLAAVYTANDSALYRITAVNSCLSIEASEPALLQVDSILPFSYADTLINACIGQDTIFELIQPGNNRNAATWFFLPDGSSTPQTLASDTSLIWQMNTIQLANRGQYYAQLLNSCGAQNNAVTIELQVNDPLQISISGDDSICFGQTAMNTGVAIGGRPANYNYFWQLDPLFISGAQLNRIQDSTEIWTAGVFDFCSEDTVYANKTIHVRSLPEVSLPADTTICKGTSIDIAAVARGGNTTTYHYLWSNGLPDTSVVNVSPAVTTTYQLILIDSCSTPTDTALITVNVLDELKVEIIPDMDTSCFGQQQFMTLKVSGGDTNQYEFVWDDGSKTKDRTIRAFADSTFYVQLTDNCTVVPGEDSFRYAVHPPLEVRINGKDTLCTNESATITATGLGGDANNYTFVWQNASNGNSQPIFTDRDTSYSVTLSDGCSSEDAMDTFNVAVRAPLQIEILGKDTLCTDEIQNLSLIATGGDATKYSYNWDDGSTLPTRTIFTANDSMFFVQLTDNCTPLAARDSFAIVVRAPLQVSIAGKDTLCLGEISNYTAIPAGGLPTSYAYDWNSSSNNPVQIKGTIDTTISVILSDGCTPQSANIQKQIVIRAPLDLTPLSDLRTCNGNTETIELIASGGRSSSYAYFVNGQPQTSSRYTRSYNDSTQLFFELRDNCSEASAYDTMWIDIRPINPFIFSVEQQNLLVKAKTLDDGTINSWGTNLNDLQTYTDSAVQISYSSYGAAQLCLQKEDDAGCTASKCIDLTLFDVYQTKDFEVTIYPNPASDKLNVGLNKVAGKVEINLITADGRYIWRNQYSTFNQTTYTYDVSELASSVYIIEVRANGEIIRERIVVQ